MTNLFTFLATTTSTHSTPAMASRTVNAVCNRRRTRSPVSKTRSAKVFSEVSGTIREPEPNSPGCLLLELASSRGELTLR
jgi:hypothetical protein